MQVIRPLECRGLSTAHGGGENARCLRRAATTWSLTAVAAAALLTFAACGGSTDGSAPQTQSPRIASDASQTETEPLSSEAITQETEPTSSTDQSSVEPAGEICAAFRRLQLEFAQRQGVALEALENPSFPEASWHEPSPRTFGLLECRLWLASANSGVTTASPSSEIAEISFGITDLSSNPALAAEVRQVCEVETLLPDIVAPLIEELGARTGAELGSVSCSAGSLTKFGDAAISDTSMNWIAYWNMPDSDFDKFDELYDPEDTMVLVATVLGQVRFEGHIPREGVTVYEVVP